MKIVHPNFPKSSAKITTLKNAPYTTASNGDFYKFIDHISTSLKSRGASQNLNLGSEYGLDVDGKEYIVSGISIPSEYNTINSDDVLIYLTLKPNDITHSKKILLSKVKDGEATPIYRMRVGFYNKFKSFGADDTFDFGWTKDVSKSLYGWQTDEKIVADVVERLNKSKTVLYKIET